MSTIIIATILVFSAIAITMIFIFINRKDEKERKRALLKLHSNAGSQHALSFSNQEILRNKIIGLDGLNQTLLILEYTNDNRITCINMTSVKDCTVEKKFDSILVGNERKAKMEAHLRSIDIKFTFKDNREPIAVTFYDSSLNNIYEMADLEIKAKNWEAVLLRMVSKQLRASA